MRPFRALVLETVVILVGGGAIALLANQLSPRGLSLTRDYFPGRQAPAGVAPSIPTEHQSAPSANQSPAERLASKGLSVLGTMEVEQLFNDPQYQQELIIFIDARDDDHYHKAHIPGAYQFDRYYPDRYLPSVLPACFSANRIIVYCNGGACEDSEFAALTFLDAGIPATKLAVYLGGITEWLAQNKPVEQGERKSGIIHSGGTP